MNELKSYIIDRIIELLEEYEDIEMYGYDIGYTIFERYNYDGTMTYSTYEAKKWIEKYFDDIGEILEELNFEFGDTNSIPNVFDNPEAFMVVIVIEGANYILSNLYTVEKYWNDKFILTKHKINAIKRELKNCNNSYEFYN